MRLWMSELLWLSDVVGIKYFEKLMCLEQPLLSPENPPTDCAPGKDSEDVSPLEQYG